MNNLPDDMRALLQAIHSALLVPLADRPEDDDTRDRLLHKRASEIQVILNSVLAKGHPLRECAAQLARWTAETPVSYASWQDRTGADPDQPVPYVPAARCPACHPDDPTECVGPVAVTALDAQNRGADGCEHHAARLLASLEGGRVYGLPDAPEGAALRVFKAADTTRPFAWLEHAPRTRPDQLSHHENREGTPVFEVEQSGADSDGWDPDDPYGDVDEYERGDR